MQRLNHVPFLMQLTVVGLIVLLALGLPALAAHPESPAAPVPTEDELHVCAGSGRSFDETSGPLVETIEVAGLPPSSQVTNVTVDLNIVHSWSGDVVAVLGHGSTDVTLVHRPGTSNTAFNCNCGCPYDNVVGTFADGAAGDADRCVFGSGGVDAAHGPYAPIGPNSLADFIGSNPNGAWNLTLTDMADDEGGSLPANGFCLTITYHDPLAVVLAEFSAVQQGDAVRVTWETNSELGNTGFNLYRGVSPDGWDRQLNEALIPSQAPGSPSGFTYTWEDRADLVAGVTYYYWVEDVNVDGLPTRHGPVSVVFSAPTAVTLGGAQGSPTAALPALPWLWVAGGAVAAGAALAVGRRRRR